MKTKIFTKVSIIKVFALAALIVILGLIMLHLPVHDETALVKKLRIIGTSDLHGKFMPWDYALNAEDTSGSVAQLRTAITQYRDDSTLLVDAGDLIQDNSADIFVQEDIVHPMVQAINLLNYDVFVPGNHEYNYGMDVVRKTISDLDCKVLTGNVYDENNKPIADGYTILEKDGVRIAIIGMVTPNITRWDAVNLANCAVTDPLQETRSIIDAIQSQYDVLIGVFHMGLNNEFNVADSGVTDILNACPEFDVMISSHEHEQIPGETINGVLVVQNRNMAKTMSVIDLTLEMDKEGWKVAEKVSDSINIADFEPDAATVELLAKYDDEARTDAIKVIGTLVGDALAPENEIAEIPSAQIQDTAFVDLINDVQMHYTGAPVSAAALCSLNANIYPGEIQKCDTALIYKYSNTLYKLRMKGNQLKKFMEWSANYYNTYHPGDLTISFNPDIRVYNYFMFSGVNYEISIANPPGSRIENLTWPDGSPVKDDDEFDFATNNYIANSLLLAPGGLFEENDLPVLLEMDVHGEIGGIRELIGDYIINVKNGVISPACNDSWKITGNTWNTELHAKAVEMLANGELVIPSSENGNATNIKSITESDLQNDPEK